MNITYFVFRFSLCITALLSAFGAKASEGAVTAKVRNDNKTPESDVKKNACMLHSRLFEIRKVNF